MESDFKWQSRAPRQHTSILMATFGVFEANHYGTGSKDNADYPRNQRTALIVFGDDSFGVGDVFHSGGLGSLNKTA